MSCKASQISAIREWLKQLFNVGGKRHSQHKSGAVYQRNVAVALGAGDLLTSKTAACA